MKKILFIVGCPRSGTSLFAQFLVNCGLRTVADDRKNIQYPHGYHEHLPLLMFHKALERLPRGGDHRITSEPFLKSEYLENPFIAEMFSLASKPIFDNIIDFIKFPQLALSEDFLVEQFPGIHIIALWRDPASVFKSLIQKEFAREMFPASTIKSILLQSVYGTHILRAQQLYPESITVFAIDDLIQNNTNLRPFLNSLGFRGNEPCRISNSINMDVWNVSVPMLWKISFYLILGFINLISGFFPVEKRPFTKLMSINKEISRICYEPFSSRS